MTEENYKYRTSQMFLRNQFAGSGKFKIPVIPKFKQTAGDFDNLLFIGFDKTKPEDNKHLNRMVHFFLYDYRFERVWNSPDNDIEKLSRYRAVLSPDFSIYQEMAPVMQLYNVFRNRWCGAYWASKGIRVIPSVNWGDESTFDFCFQGIEKGSTVAVSTYMASESEHHKDQKEWFLTGYKEMLRQIEPERIICYHTPFEEMEGNIVYVDYNRSSWRYMNYEETLLEEKLNCYKIGNTYLHNRDIISTYAGKGGGSAYGGKWKPSPNKPLDNRYLGKPGEIKITITNKGNIYRTKIGSDGRAESERHETDHGRDNTHTNPHDHKIDWNNPDEHPRPGPPINYPNGAPEFKQYKRDFSMSDYIIIPDGSMNFESISEFKRSLNWGAEIEFVWNNVTYGVMRYGTDNKITIYQMYRPETEKVCETADEALEYMLGNDRLRDVITKVEVVFRSN